MAVGGRGGANDPSRRSGSPPRWPEPSNPALGDSKSSVSGNNFLVHSERGTGKYTLAVEEHSTRRSAPTDPEGESTVRGDLMGEEAYREFWRTRAAEYGLESSVEERQPSDEPTS